MTEKSGSWIEGKNSDTVGGMIRTENVSAVKINSGSVPVRWHWDNRHTKKEQCKVHAAYFCAVLFQCTKMTLGSRKCGNASLVGYRKTQYKAVGVAVFSPSAAYGRVLFLPDDSLFADVVDELIAIDRDNDLHRRLCIFKNTVGQSGAKHIGSGIHHANGFNVGRVQNHNVGTTIV